MKERKKRVPCHNPQPPPPLIQVMPERRVRIDPTCVPDIVCWLMALKERYEERARINHRHLSGRARAAARGLSSWGVMACTIVDELAQSLLETVSLDAFDRAREEWRRALTPKES